MILTVTGDTTATADVSVEELQIVNRAFASPEVDLTEFDVDKVVVSRSSAGFSSEIEITAGGDFEYEFTGGITTATFDEYDEGLINTGSLTTLNLDGTATEANLNVTAGTVLLAEVVGGGGTLVDLNATIAAGAALNLDDDVDLTGDIVIQGSGTLRGDQDTFSGAEIEAAAATLRIDDVTTPGAFDLENVNVAAIQVNTDDPVEFTNAEGKTFNLTASAAFGADTSDEGGSYTVNVRANNVTIDTVGVELDSSNVNVFATALVTNAASIVAGGTTNINVTGASFTIDVLAETNPTDIVRISGDQRLTLSDVDLTTLDASAYTGNITIEDSILGAATSLTTGSGADSITIDTDKITSYDISTGAGNDTVTATSWVGAADEGLYIDLGTGNDRVVLGTAQDAFVPVVDSILIIDGGDGTDTVAFGSGAAAGVDFTGVNFVIAGVELITIREGTYTFEAPTLHQQTGLEIQGTAATGEEVAVNTVGTSSALDLSGITFTNVDSLTVDLRDTRASSAFTGKLSAIGETVEGPDTGTFGFTLDLGAGNDEITLTGGGGTLTLGAGSDDVIVAADSSSHEANLLVSITDFSIVNDSLDMLEDVADDILAGAAVDVSDATSADDSFSAYVKDGKIVLVGDDAANVDTLAEWVAVAEEIGVDGTYSFSFGGDLYVTSVGITTTETIRLIGLGDANGVADGGGVGIVTVV
jgi:hypothetical protein